MTKKKAIKKKKTFRFKKSLKKVILFIKERFPKWFKKAKKATKESKAARVGLTVLVIAFIFLGFSLKWEFNSNDGLSCSGDYTPPDPEDVKKVINLREAPKKAMR